METISASYQTWNPTNERTAEIKAESDATDNKDECTIETHNVE